MITLGNPGGRGIVSYVPSTQLVLIEFDQPTTEGAAFFFPILDAKIVVFQQHVSKSSGEIRIPPRAPNLARIDPITHNDARRQMSVCPFHQAFLHFFLYIFKLFPYFVVDFGIIALWRVFKFLSHVI